MAFDFDALINAAVENRAKEAAERHDNLIEYLHKVRENDVGRKLMLNISNMFESEAEHQRNRDIDYESFLHSLLGKD